MSDVEKDISLPKISASKILERQKEEREELKKKIERIKISIPKKDRIGRARAAEEAAEEEKKLLESQLSERQEYDIDESTIAALMPQLTINDTSEDPPNNTSKQESRAARRRRKKAEQDAETQRRVEEEKANMGPSPKFVETKAIEEQLNPKNLIIYPVAADGHCLYSAVAHQMTSCNIASDVPASVDGLRNATADHLSTHQEEYIPFVEEVGGDKDAFNRYCERLRTTAVWGGQVELKALTEILNTGIEVYAANMPVVQMGNCEESESVLRVSFHRQYYSLGEHYNSVIPKN